MYRSGGRNAMEEIMIVASDGHATAKMDDYRAYLPVDVHEDFDAFCALYREHGAKNFDVKALSGRLDADELEIWSRDFVDSGRVEGFWNPARRTAEMDAEGTAAEVIFPDFGLPWELRGSITAVAKYGANAQTSAQIDLANRAWNRWVVDFASSAPERFAPMALVTFDDIDYAVAEIVWAKEAGFRGVLLPRFSEQYPLFHPRFNRIWSTLEDLDLPANCHAVTSSTTDRSPLVPTGTPPQCALPLISNQVFFYAHELLSHLIWGGVLERHPKLRVVFTEMGSGWTIGHLRNMDYTYEGSFLRRDIRDVVRSKPSEYFARQCFLGSSIYSKAEIEARREIGISKMMLGSDYPHHEGTMLGGNIDYMQATLGAAAVTTDEARLMLGETAAKLFALDTAALTKVATRIGPSIDAILQKPTRDRFTRGDVHKPLASVV
jgi:predicted TIM-barrel fold metal-dependent hydrolase